MNLVDIKIHSPTATILMGRAGDGNSLDERLIEDIGQALDDLHQEKKIGAVVLAGAGKDFCVGMDLNELYQHTTLDPLDALPLWIEHWDRLLGLLEKMLRFPRPIVAAVDGRACGAGFSLALAADMIVVSQSATFSIPATGRGMVAGLVAPLLAFRAGAAIASRMLMAGDTMSSRQAIRIGLAAQRVPEHQVWVAANRLALRSASLPGSPVGVTKRLLNETIGESLLTQLSVGAATAATACSTETAAEGLRAFIEGREPVWP